MRKALLFALILFGIDSIFAVTHSLQYVYSAMSGIPNLPEFIDVGLLDGEPFTYYDSDIRRKIPRQEWMTKAVDADYWDQGTQNLMGTELVFINDIKVLKPRFNQTGGKSTCYPLHIYLLIKAPEIIHCTWQELHPTGARSCDPFPGLLSDALCRLHVNRLPYAPHQLLLSAQENRASESALTVKTLRGLRQGSNSLRSPLVLVPHGTDLCTVVGQCVRKHKRPDLIPAFAVAPGYRDSPVDHETGWEMSAYSLSLEFRPEVSLLQKDPSSPVTCHTTGFFPKGIVVTWRKDGEDMHSDVEVGETLPNGDGKFQITSKLTVKPEDWKMNSYSCVVQHKSLQDDIAVLLEEKNIRTNQGGISWGIIIGCVAAALALVAVVIGLVLWRRSRTGYGKAGTSDTDSENSSQQQPKA
nr:major histocompatibility complex class I-related gene protein-like [Paramormyrops kingsleyae]